MGLQNSLSEGDRWSQCVQSRYTEVINLRFPNRSLFLFLDVLGHSNFAILQDCLRRARGREGRERREKRKRHRKGNDGVPTYDASVQGHTKRRREGFPAMTEASRDTQARKKGEERKRNRRREREREERERERERKEKEERGGKKRKGTGVPSYEARVQGHTPGRGVYLSVQEHPKRQRKKRGEGKGRKGSKVPTGSNEP